MTAVVCNVDNIDEVSKRRDASIAPSRTKINHTQLRLATAQPRNHRCRNCLCPIRDKAELCSHYALFMSLCNLSIF